MQYHGSESIITVLYQMTGYIITLYLLQGSDGVTEPGEQRDQHGGPEVRPAGQPGQRGLPGRDGPDHGEVQPAHQRGHCGGQEAVRQHQTGRE